MTVDTYVPVAVAAEAIKIGGPLSVIHHAEVEPAVVIIVEPSRGHGPLVALDAGLLCDVLEAAVPQVAIQNVPVNARHKQVHVAVIVIVGGGAAHRVPGAGDASFASHVGEFHSAIIPVKTIRELRRAFLRSEENTSELQAH